MAQPNSPSNQSFLSNHSPLITTPPHSTLKEPFTYPQPLSNALPKPTSNNLEDKVDMQVTTIDSGLIPHRPIRKISKPTWLKDFI